MEEWSGAVHEHCRYDEPEELRELLEASVAAEVKLDGLVDVLDRFGNSALHKAAGNGNLECCKVLLSANAQLQINEAKATALHWAILNKHLDVVKLLMSAFHDTVDVLDSSKYKKTLMNCAFECENNDVLKVILEHKSAAPLDEVQGDSMEDGSTSFTSGDTTERVHADEHEEKKQELYADVKYSTELTSLTHSFELCRGIPQNINEVAPHDEGHVGELPSKETVQSVLQVREIGDVSRKANQRDESDLLGVEDGKSDVTGLYVWAASIVLARWVVLHKHMDVFRGARVLEMGAGCGLPSLAIARYTEAKEVVASDYLDDVVNNIKHNIQVNEGLESRVTARVLDWDFERTAMPSAFEDPFDVIVGSDLVYHEGIVPILLKAVDVLLKPGGCFVFVHKDQRHSVNAFVKLLSTVFTDVQTEMVPQPSTVEPSAAPSGRVLSAEDQYYLGNPLRGVSDNMAELYFPELNEAHQFSIVTFIGKKNN